VRQRAPHDGRLTRPAAAGPACTTSGWWIGLQTRVAAWFDTLPCPASGRWPIAAQALHPWSVDATALALDLAQMLGLDLPAATIDAAFAALDGQQDPATGFFHEPHAAELDASVHRIHEMSGTYLGYQVAAVMLAAGRAPRHRFAFYDPLLPAGRLERTWPGTCRGSARRWAPATCVTTVRRCCARMPASSTPMRSRRCSACAAGWTPTRTRAPACGVQSWRKAGTAWCRPATT
jgi:hypothetical protein